ncbi:MULTISPECIES: Uma2 family endonuclease [unclassified Streptomyces]|uniref:Uma2 family endonuclease n=1 Tax=unclassified Streptomyces TaxID=2593676 RepID=UPI00035EFFFF|nr:MULTISPECIES: Uma2 family endonuclease [unclassified Streptomyces]MYT33263.1 Uma2 family endonuclease [Streptomyces sp. SID8354]
MTISLERTEWIEMAKSGDLTLDQLFDQLERMPVPEGYKVEIVEGTVFMSPQRDVHWDTIFEITTALREQFGGKKRLVKSDVRIDFPGEKNGFCPDVAKLAENAKKENGRWRYQDVEFVAEVISKGTAANDYGPKLTAYATAEVPVYVIADPYLGRCRVFTQPKDGDYENDVTVSYGEPIDLTDTVLGMTLSTEDFPRD